MEGSSRLVFEPRSPENVMQLSLGVKSILFFLLSVSFLVLLTLLESFMTGLSLNAERILSVFLLVLPAAVGVILGALSIARKEPRVWLGILGILLNAMFALFHLFLISFAG
jgi:hypothetical protein